MATTVDWDGLWEKFCDELRSCGKDVLRSSPAGDLDHAEGLRYVARLLRYAIGQQLDYNPPNKLPLNYEVARIAGDNPDYRYVLAKLDGCLTYRLRGRINDASRISFGTYSGGVDTSNLLSTGSITNEDLILDNDGHFDICLTSRPSGGNELPMSQDTSQLIIRETLLNRQTDIPAEYTLTCLEEEAASVIDAHAIFQGFEQVIRFVPGTLRHFLKWTMHFEKNPNQISPVPEAFLAVAQGDGSTRYFNGYFEFPDDRHALIVRFTPPPCEYWNLQICNHWLESIDPVQAPTNLNIATAEREDDGSVAIVIAPSNPGMPNWLDTVGHLRGGIVVRYVGVRESEDPQPPACRIVSIAESVKSV